MPPKRTTTEPRLSAQTLLNDKSDNMSKKQPAEKSPTEPPRRQSHPGQPKTNTTPSNNN